MRMTLGGMADAIRAMSRPAITGYLVPRSPYDRYCIRGIYSSMVALRKAYDERNGEWFEAFQRKALAYAHGNLRGR